MSIESWKQEFYTVEADVEMTEQEAIIHSIKKWGGLTAENRNKHKLDVQDSQNLVDEFGELFGIDSSTCALCIKFISDNCKDCPLYKKLGAKCGEGCETDGYYSWELDDDPSLMLENLRSLLLEGDDNKCSVT